ncbi:hypothetical protein [Nocardia sp. NBC_00416]|uniref:hypothetical protein n=1 Tax=Nocardia sp. NBC_00416 TaxID=2975991 RepID=UPI002E1DE2E4
MTEVVGGTVPELLRQVAASSPAERSVNEVLSDFGLPRLPDLPPAPPLPDLPPLPPLDLTAMAKPLTDLIGGFGTGALGANGGADPAQVLSQASGVLTSAMSVATTGLSILTSLWQGAGADSAAIKQGLAQTDGAAVAAQSDVLAAGVTEASATVAVGAAEMSAVIAKFVSTMTAVGPFLATPPGQTFALIQGIEAMAEGTAVVAKTRAAMTGHTAKMAGSGTKIPVTRAPSGLGTPEAIRRLLNIAQSLTGAAPGAIPAAGMPQLAHAPVQPRPHVSPGGRLIGHRSGVGSGPAPAVSGAGARAPRLSEFGPRWAAPSGTPTGTGSELGGGPAQSRASAAVAPGSGAVPAGALGAVTPRTGDADVTAAEVKAQLVTESNGREVVDDPGGWAVPVLGGGDPIRQRADPFPPDKRFTL